MPDVKLNEATARNRGDLSDTDSLVVIPHEADDDTGASTHAPEKISWNQLKQEMDARGPGEDNVQSNWNEGNTGSDAFIQNKPTIPTVETGGTIKSKLEGLSGSARLDASAVKNLPSGGGSGEQNVQADWNETDSTDDAYIQNKPTIPTVLSQLGGTVADNQIPAGIARDSEVSAAIAGVRGGVASGRDTLKELSDAVDAITPGDANVQSDWSETDSTDDAFIRNKPTIPAAETGAGIKSKLEALSGSARLDASAVKNLPSGGGSGEANVQADWNETDTSDDAYIQNKPTIPTALSQLTGSVSDGQIPASITRDTELAGSITQLKGQGLPANRDTMKELSDAIDAIVPGDNNVQSNWNEGNTGSDAYIQNKPTIPVVETGGTIKSKLEGLSGNARLDASAVKNLPSGGGSGSFDLYADVGDETTALAAGDRLVVADISETGEPNRYITAGNARKYLRGYRGTWGSLTQNTDRLYVGDIVQHASEWYFVKVEHLRGGSGPDGDSTNFAPLDNYRGNFTAGSYQPGIIVRHNSKTWLSLQQISSGDPVPGAAANVKWAELGANNTVSDTALTEWFNQAVTITTAGRLVALPSPNPTIPEHGILICAWTDRGASTEESSSISLPCERLRGLTARAVNDNVSSRSSANVIRVSVHIGNTGGRIYATFARDSNNRLLVAVDNASDDPAPLRIWHMPTGGEAGYEEIDISSGNVTLSAAQVNDLHGKTVLIENGSNQNHLILSNASGINGTVCFTAHNCDNQTHLFITGRNGGGDDSIALGVYGSVFVVVKNDRINGRQMPNRFVDTADIKISKSVSVGYSASLNADTDAEKRALVDKIDAIKVHDLSSGNVALTLNAVNNINGKTVVVDSGGISNRTFTFTNQGMTGRGFCFIVNKGTAAISIRGRSSGVTSSNSLAAGAAAKVIFATDLFTVTTLAAGAAFDLWDDISRSASVLHDIDRIVFGDSRSTGNPNTWINAANARKFFKAYRGEWGNLTQNSSRIYVGDILLHNGGYYLCKTEHLRGGSGPDGDTTNFVAIETYWGDFNSSYDYHIGRIVKHDNKFWINDATISSSDPAPGAAGNTKWHRIDGGGGSGGATTEPVLETVNADTTFYLSEKWASWKNKRVIFKTNGSDPTITFEPDGGSGLWVPGSELDEQTVDVATSEFYAGSDNVTLEPTASGRTQITESALLPSSGDRYFARARLFTTNGGRLDLLFEANRSVSTGSATGQDLSDEFETSGTIVIEINSQRIEISMSGVDTTEPYRLNNLGQNFIDQVNTWRALGNGGATAKITFAIFDDADEADSVGDSIEFEPLWQEAQVQLRRMIFARHDSDGAVTTFESSATARNATEGEGVNFRLTFAHEYYTGSNTHKWIVSPLTQRVDGVVADFARAGNVLNKVPAALLPHGHGGQVVGTHVATSGEFRMVQASHPINARITASAVGTDTVTAFNWDIQTNALAAVYNGRDEKFELPYKRRVQNQNGYFLQAVRAADDAVTSEIFIPFDMSSGSDLRFIDSDGNLADLELFANTTNNQSSGSNFRLTRWTIEPNEQFWIEWNPGTGPNWTAKFADDEFFYIKIYEWIDSASPIATSSGGSAQGQGAFDLRREEEVAASLSGTTSLLGGSAGFRVDENATHLEIEIDGPANLTPDGVVWNYQLPGENTWHDLYDDDGDRILLHRSETVKYRFNDAFFHLSGGRNYVKTRFSSTSSMSGSLIVTLKHEEDVNSATIKPLKLLTSQVVVAAQTLSSGLSGATMNEVDFDVPVEYDNLISLTILLTTSDSHAYEKSKKRLIINRDELEEVGLWESTDTLANSTNIKGWFSEGWSSQGNVSALSSWNVNSTADNVYHYANNNTPSRIIAVQKTGAYLTGLYVATFKQPTTIKNISCMRKI